MDILEPKLQQYAYMSWYVYSNALYGTGNAGDTELKYLMIKKNKLIW